MNTTKTESVLRQTTAELARITAAYNAAKAERDQLLQACKRIAYEPQGKSDASHAEVLQAVEQIARAAIANAEKGEAK